MYAKMCHVARTGARENSRDSHVKKREPTPVSGSEVGSGWRPWLSFVLVNLTYARGLIWRTDADELTPRGISCRVVLSAKTTESAAVWLQQLKYNNGAADKILWLLVKEPTADVRRFLFARGEKRPLRRSSVWKCGALTERNPNCGFQERSQKGVF